MEKHQKVKIRNYQGILKFSSRLFKSTYIALRRQKDPIKKISVFSICLEGHYEKIKKIDPSANADFLDDLSNYSKIISESLKNLKKTKHCSNENDLFLLFAGLDGMDKTFKKFVLSINTEHLSNSKDNLKPQNNEKINELKDAMFELSSEFKIAKILFEKMNGIESVPLLIEDKNDNSFETLIHPVHLQTLSKEIPLNNIRIDSCVVENFAIKLTRFTLLLSHTITGTYDPTCDCECDGYMVPSRVYLGTSVGSIKIRGTLYYHGMAKVKWTGCCVSPCWLYWHEFHLIDQVIAYIITDNVTDWWSAVRRGPAYLKSRGGWSKWIQKLKIPDLDDICDLKGRYYE